MAAIDSSFLTEEDLMSELITTNGTHAFKTNY